MKRILSISQYGADLAKGSAFSGALERQKDYALATRSYVVIVPGSSGAQEYREGNLRVIPTAGSALIGFLIDALALEVALHREDPFDAVMVDNPHVMGLFGLIAQKRLGVPLIVHSMADMPWNPWYNRERFANRLKQVVMRFVIRRANYVRVSTTVEVARLREQGIPEKRIALVPFYIDHDAFLRALNHVRIAREPHRIVFVGRLGLQKDLGTLIRAMRVLRVRVPTARLAIVGSGSEHARLEKLARAEGVHESIEFLGAIARERVAQEFAEASVFALPSLYEGTCMVLHEAALAGMPIVATDNAGARDFIEPGIHGDIVRVRDHRAMGEALADILQDPALHSRMSAAVRERVKTATRPEALRKWEELLARI
jgi:glycosyltransferase involved in cell wall biosynthesis